MLKSIGRFFACLTVSFVLFGDAQSNQMQFVAVAMDSLYDFTTHGKCPNGAFLAVCVLPRVVIWFNGTKFAL